jgi:cobaltochelatase CobS
VEEIVDKVMEKVGKEKIDPELIVGAVLKKIDGKFSDSVVASVVKTLDERLPRKVEIVVKNAETGKAIKVVGARHKNFERLLKIASLRGVDGQRLGIFLSGEASSGKTTGAKQVAEALGLKWYFNGAISLPHEMLGFIDGAGTYHRTPFRDAYEFGGVYTFDEVDRSDPNALLAVNPHLANGVATFPDKQVKRHKDCIIICTANTWGLGMDANYSGATKLDAAFLSRFPVKISWDIDLDLEFAIVNNKEWLARVRRARANARAVGLKVMIDVRTSLAGSTLIDEGGFSSDEAAELTYLANLKPEQRKQIELV